MFSKIVQFPFYRRKLAFKNLRDSFEQQCAVIDSKDKDLDVLECELKKYKADNRVLLEEKKILILKLNT
jgi:hypothetical protein